MKSVVSLTKMLDSLILMQIEIKGPLHGYALVSSIEEKFGWKPSQTAVYNSLKSMENENIVKVEEKIESGRVQKIYSITEKGRMILQETKKRIKEHMSRNMAQFFSFVQMVEDIENVEESKAFQKKVQGIFEDLRSVSKITMVLLKEAPNETQEIISNCLSSLKKIAKKHEIELDEEDFEG
ncbi:MAG: PadR family transcriptional regulator [Candidatus Heimdallarchaeaceae archaeon]